MSPLHVLVVFLAVFLCASCQTPEERALAYIRDCGGTYWRDEALPGKPVVGVILIPDRMPRKRPSDGNLEAIRPLTELHRLELGGSRITDAGLRHLKGLTKLQCLGLGATYISDTGLIDLLGELKNLRELDLSSTEITGVGLKGVSELVHLYKLHLSETTDGEIKAIKQMNSLECLWLVYANVTDVGLKELRDMSNLRELNLKGSGITDASLVALREFKGLRRLDVSGTLVSRDGLSAFRKAMPDTQTLYTYRPNLRRLTPPSDWVAPPIGR